MASPDTTETAIGRKSGSTTTRAAKPTKIPLSVMLSNRAPPSPGPPRPVWDVILTAIAMTIGIVARTTSIA